MIAIPMTILIWLYLSHFYEMYYLMQNIQQVYYNEFSFYNPVGYDLANYVNKPLFAFDCTRTDESVKSGMVDVRLEIEASKNFPSNTAAYCLIIHDNLIRYSPFSGLVHRDI